MFITRTVCPACGSDQFEVLIDLAFTDSQLTSLLTRFYQSRVDLDLLSTHRYTLCECQRCSLVYQQHILNDAGMSALYGDWISADDSLDKRQYGSANIFRKYAAEAETISRIVGKPPHQTSVLEFGMGWGYWSRMAAAFNFRVTGIELSPERIKHAHSLGVIAATDLAEVDYDSIDFIYANQVLEHIPEPDQVMRQLYNRLTVGGVILVRVPNGTGTSNTLRKKGWQPDMNAVHPLEHINTFTRSSLITLGRAIGLKPMRPPVRLSGNSPAHFLRSAKREISDRFLAPHVYFIKSR